MKRRSFLKNSSFLTLPMLLNGIPISAVGKNMFFDSFAGDNDNVLVLIQLNGGNDGLNTIIPLDKYNILGNVRSNILIPENKVIKITDKVGFNPAMTGLKDLYDNGNLTVIQDTGYPNQNRSHFRSIDIWKTGSPAEQFWTTGWMGRYYNNRFPEFPVGYPNDDNPHPFAITLGNAVSETCQGTLANFSLALTDPFSLSPLSDSANSAAPDTPYGQELDFLRTAISQSNAYSVVVSEAAEKGKNSSSLYGNSNLEEQLKTIALLIAGGLQTKVYVANLGGFDTHANQVEEGDTTTGNHTELLGNLSSAMNAFQDDLNKLGLNEKVITMTFSEFGRRIRSNDSLGTDHGTAAPLLISGSCINPGFIGSTPDLPKDPGVGDGVPMQYDFRDIYGSILMDWFGVEKNEVKSLLFEDFQHIPLINSCQTTTPTIDTTLDDTEIYNFPNPCRDWTTINFESQGEHYRVSLFDGLGREVKILSNKKLAPGPAKLKVETRDFAPGNYFYRISSIKGIRTKALVKI
ncbi:MAG: DUF1501 domain-containing protein [Saprospiraceae bacterium]